MVSLDIEDKIHLLFESLKNTIENYYGSKIAYDELSELLGMNKRYIYRIQQELDQKEFYSITNKTFERWIQNINYKLPKISKELISYIEQFRRFQNCYPIAQRSSKHPTLKIKYFDKINSKEKAYWLGLLFADGNVGKDHRVTFHQNQENSELVYRFAEVLGYNKKKIEIGDNKVKLRIGNKRLAAALKRYGCVPAKSRILRLPNLKSRELYLAFLLVILMEMVR